MKTINIKPMSINKAYTGKRYKTPEYRSYIKDVLYMLPKIKLPEAPYRVYYEFGVSNMSADTDNPVKPFQDILQKKYKINDKNIHEFTARKVKVKKGKEYIKFEIKSYE